MKKLFIIMFALALALTFSPANACDPGENCEAGPTTAAANLIGQSPDSDSSSSSTGAAGNNNDSSAATADSWVFGQTDNFGFAEGCIIEKIRHSDLVYAGSVYKKVIKGHWKYTYYGKKWVKGSTTYKTFPSQTGTHGWTFVRKTYETRIWYETVYTPNRADAGATLELRDAETKTWAWSFDSGSKSGAGAGAIIEGDRKNAYVGGYGSGGGSDNETSYTKVGLGGSISQNNEAGETGYYGGTYAVGSNMSGAAFSAYDTAYDEGNGYAATHLHGINAGAKVEGMTIVDVNKNSVYAMTENMARVTGSADEFTSVVYGSGGVGANIGNGNGTYAGGSANFSFVGGTSGAGNAFVEAFMSPGGVSAYAGAHATSIGNAPLAD